MNLYQHAKNQAFSLFYSRDIFDLKIPQSDGPRAFWVIYQEPECPQIWDLFKHTAVNIIFDYKPNWEKIIN